MFPAKYRRFERNFDGYLQVLAAFNIRRTAPASTPLTAEKCTEDIVKSAKISGVESAKIEPAEARPGAVKGTPELVVLLTLLGAAQHLIRLVHLFKLFRVAVLALIRMVL